VYWYRVLPDGEEVEVTTQTHTENWNGNPNKYVPERRVEVRQIDQIRHVIIFHQVRYTVKKLLQKLHCKKV
jgi:hypothetical protein